MRPTRCQLRYRRLGPIAEARIVPSGVGIKRACVLRVERAYMHARVLKLYGVTT